MEPELRGSLLDFREQRESAQFCPAAQIWGVSVNSQDVFAELKVEYFNRVFVPCLNLRPPISQPYRRMSLMMLSNIFIHSLVGGLNLIYGCRQNESCMFVRNKSVIEGIYP